ncbi:hypothetical protein C0Q70_13387 [Pomacea canaliculata]|uniref:Uncharacterized protein n=1 Tax=Pomacea canaliculata TaxID=400727 RepID=A0A2T7NX29_POMCA|nr:hypothetical protein C0Q70_13387 [Pomacea canaliculata]
MGSWPPSSRPRLLSSRGLVGVVVVVGVVTRLLETSSGFNARSGCYHSSRCINDERLFPFDYPPGGREDCTDLVTSTVESTARSVEGFNSTKNFNGRCTTHTHKDNHKDNRQLSSSAVCGEPEQIHRPSALIASFKLVPGPRKKEEKHI